MATAPALTSGPRPDQDVKLFSGAYLVWALNNHGFRRKVGGSRLPHYRHETIDAAVAEAARLNTLNPATTFVVIQECARIKSVAQVAA